MTDTAPNTAETNPSPDEIRWSALDQDELCEAYWETVAPILQAQGYNPEDHRPTHDWLRTHGCRSLLYTLRENHNLTFSIFWNDVLDLDDNTDNEYDWGITDETTIELLTAYLQSLEDRRELSESSIRTIRYRLARYARAYSTVNNDDDLITPVAPGSDVPPHEAVDASWQAFDYLHNDLNGGEVKQRIHKAVDSWYSHLVRRKRAALNPADGVDDEFKWTREPGDNPRLAPEHVQHLYAEAESHKERLMVVGLAAWGLRTGEVAALHRSQFISNGDETPYIAFDERKNGPGEVSVLFGESVYEERLIELSDRDSWNGYLFPSSGSAAGHVTADTIRNWFDDLAAVAGLPEGIDGEKPVPQMGRRFWYDAYSSVLDNVLEGMDEIAEEQGSSSAAVVLENYLSDERNRDIRRAQMRKRLSEAFPSIDES